MRLRRILVALAVLFTSARATAHTVGLSTGEYTPRPEGLRAKLSFARSEAAALVPALDANRDGHVTALEVDAAKKEIEAKILARIRVEAPSPCPAVLTSVGLSEQDGLAIEGRFDCGGGGPFAIDAGPLLAALAPGHRHVVRVLGAGIHDEVLEAGQSVLVVARPTATLEPQTAPVADDPAWSFFRMGLGHILGGYDHLLFIFALLLARTRLRDLALVITAFTLGHSVTLALAVLGIFAPSARFVEPAIALSIAYVGLENLRGTTAHRWRVTLPFGMLHGFGFAGALREVALPASQLPVALATFNLGVEAGQLLVIALLLPLVMLARRRVAGFEPRGVRFLSAAIVLAGVAWFVVRVT